MNFFFDFKSLDLVNLSRHPSADGISSPVVSVLNGPFLSQLGVKSYT